jgi:hypothetical protein
MMLSLMVSLAQQLAAERREGVTIANIGLCLMFRLPAIFQLRRVQVQVDYALVLSQRVIVEARSTQFGTTQAIAFVHLEKATT